MNCPATHTLAALSILAAAMVPSALLAEEQPLSAHLPPFLLMQDDTIWQNPYYSEVEEEEPVRDLWREVIAPGVDFTFELRHDEPLAISTLTVETGREDLFMEPRYGNDLLLGRNTIPGQVERTYDRLSRPIGAINADFGSAGGGPGHGMFIGHGLVWKLPNRMDLDADVPSRSSISWDEEGNHFFGAPRIEALLRGPEGSDPLRLTIVNHPLDDRSNTLFNEAFPEDSTPEPPEGLAAFMVELEGEEILPNAPVGGTITTAPGGESFSLAPGRIVVHAGEPLPDWIEEDAEVTLDIRLPELPGKVIGAIGGGPLILKDGEIVAVERGQAERMGASIYVAIHPRTAIGVKEDGKTIVAIVVDGRQPGYSRGVTVTELAELLREKGAVRAINLDGGGSSTMVVHGSVANSPSDTGGLRSLTNAILFRRTGEPGPPAGLELLPHKLRLPLGSSFNVTVRGVSADGESYRLDTEDHHVFLSAAGGQVTAYEHLKPGKDKVTLRARQPGRTEVRAAISGQHIDARQPAPTGGATVIVEEPVSLSFQPPAMQLEPGESLPIQVLTEAPSGEPFTRGYLYDGMEVPDFLSWSPEDGTITALEEGAGHVRVAAAGLEAALPVAVSQYSEVPLLSFDELPPDGLDLLNADPEGSSLTLERDNVRTGEAAWRLQYAMTRGGTTRIAIPMEIELPTDHPLALGLWVYGDGQGQWMRAILSDADGRTIYTDFTDPDPGIDWEDEWRFLRSNLQKVIPPGTMSPPFTLELVYLVQPDQERKRDGELLLDGLVLLELPEELQSGEE